MDEISGQPHAPTSLLQGEVPPGNHWIGGWTCPQTSLGALAKGKIPIIASGRNRTPVVQPVAQSIYWLRHRGPALSSYLKLFQNGGRYVVKYLQCVSSLIPSVVPCFKGIMQYHWMQDLVMLCSYRFIEICRLFEFIYVKIVYVNV